MKNKWHVFEDAYGTMWACDNIKNADRYMCEHYQKMRTDNVKPCSDPRLAVGDDVEVDRLKSLIAILEESNQKYFQLLCERRADENGTNIFAELRRNYDDLLNRFDALRLACGHFVDNMPSLSPFKNS